MFDRATRPAQLKDKPKFTRDRSSAGIPTLAAMICASGAISVVVSNEITRLPVAEQKQILTQLRAAIDEVVPV